MQRVTLPDGHHAVLRDKVNVGGRQALERTVGPVLTAYRRVRKLRDDAGVDDVEPDDGTVRGKIPYSEAEIDAIQRFQKAAIVALVKHWSKEDEPPHSIEEVDEMDPEDFEPLAKAVAPLAWEALRRKKTGVDDGYVEGADGAPVAVLNSPTMPSNGSASVERASGQNPADLGSTSTTKSTESLESATSASSSPE